MIHVLVSNAANQMKITPLSNAISNIAFNLSDQFLPAL